MHSIELHRVDDVAFVSSQFTLRVTASLKDSNSGLESAFKLKSSTKAHFKK